MATTKFYFGLLEFPQRGMSDFLDDTPDDEIDLRRHNLYEYVRQSDVVYIEPEDDGEEAVWRFGKCEKVDGNIIGKFGKEFTDEQTQWDEDEEDYVKERERVEIADVSHFVIYPELPGIVFNRKLRIGPNQFRDAFVEGYNTNPEFSGRISMRLLRTGGDKEFQEVISEAQKVTEVEFDLEPTNPYPQDDMEILDDHIRAMNADEFEMTARVEEDQEEDEDKDDDSLDPSEDFIRSGAALSEGGYGNYIVDYITSDGEEQLYNSRGERAKEEVPEPETLGGIRPHINRLQERLDQLISRDSDNSQEQDDNDNPQE